MARPSLLAVSDLHVSHAGYWAVVEQIRPYGDGDWLIVAGDVADRAAHVEKTLQLLADRFARVVWVPGNHDLWTTARDEVTLPGPARYQHLVEMARGLGVVTPEDPFPVWTAVDADGVEEELVVAPIFPLYDYSWRPAGMSIDEALEHGRETGVVCTDEFLLEPAPYPSRAAWGQERLRISRERLDAVPVDRRTILVSHWPLTRVPTTILNYPHFAMWCGSEATEDWHRRYRAAIAVYGHLHIPVTYVVDGVRHEEVSLGYPREWKARSQLPPQPVRRIEPADPERRLFDHATRAWRA